MYVLASDNRGQYEIPFPVVFRDDSWRDAHTGEELDTFLSRGGAQLAMSADDAR